jgi:ABC-2 type transport system ATP-binding protein
MENIRLYGALYGEGRSRVESMACGALARMGLLEFQDRLAGNLSGGMKQKLALAVGIIHKPRMIFLDEPTTGVDPLSRREFWAMLYELNSDGVTIIVSTPYMDEAELCTDLIFLNRGAVLMRGSPGDLLNKYKRSVFEVEASSRGLEKILSAAPGVVSVNLFGTHYHVEAEADAAMRALRLTLDSSGHGNVRVSKISPSLEDLFVSCSADDGDGLE